MRRSDSGTVAPGRVTAADSQLRGLTARRLRRSASSLRPTPTQTRADFSLVRRRRHDVPQSRDQKDTAPASWVQDSQPRRRDFPIVEGRERVVEATFCGARGHALTATRIRLRNIRATFCPIQRSRDPSGVSRGVSFDYIAIRHVTTHQSAFKDLLRHIATVKRIRIAPAAQLGLLLSRPAKGADAQ